MTFIKFKGIFLTVLFALLILIFSIKSPVEVVVTKFLVSDKLLHLFAYCLLVIPVSLERKIPLLSVFLIFLAYGGCIELIQPFAGREASIMDFVANALGIILGILLARCLTLIFKVNH